MLVSGLGRFCVAIFALPRNVASSSTTSRRGSCSSVACCLFPRAQFLLFQDAVNPFLQTHDAAENITNSHQLISALKQALDLNYAPLLETATKEWERSFAGKDPSDACVSVRVTSGDSQRLARPRAGFLRKRGRSFPSGRGRPSLA
jgi:hypothetical protein